jgi:hypothetical protein
MGEPRPPEAAKGSSGPFREANAASTSERPVGCLTLVSSRPGLTGAHSEYRRSDYRYARDQREAGIEDLEWEDRLPPMRPWMFWLAVAGSWAVFVGAFWWTAAIL